MGIDSLNLKVIRQNPKNIFYLRVKDLHFALKRNETAMDILQTFPNKSPMTQITLRSLNQRRLKAIQEKEGVACIYGLGKGLMVPYAQIPF